MPGNAQFSVPSGNFEIRETDANDASEILRLISELAEYERMADEVVATEALLKESLFGSNPRAFCDLAIFEGKAVGMALWFYNFSTFRGKHGIYLEDLYVEPEQRGKGIGKALLANLARRCEEQGLPRLDWAVLDWNEPSIEFYKSLGAVPMDVWTTFRLTGDALDSLANVKS